ncbi:MAG: cyclic nucleotide-binding domain-containing protein [Archangium sp.]|nr:cyclic nucleotide-binding domain-containing protein [Archangium sp.]
MDVDILRNVALFEGMTSAQLRKLGAVLKEVRHPVGTFIFREGEAGHSMFIIREGKVRISKNVPGVGEEALAILERGQYFGEMSLIEDGPRSADAIAHIECALYELSRDKLDQVMFTDKELASTLLWTFVRTLSSRLRETNDKIRAFFALSSFGPK